MRCPSRRRCSRAAASGSSSQTAARSTSASSARSPPALKAHPALSVDSRAALADLAQTLASAGHEPRWDEDVPGVMRFYVDDPFGNRIELTLAGARAKWSRR
jgi:catechol-2,3-dioxygenase